MPPDSICIESCPRVLLALLAARQFREVGLAWLASVDQEKKKKRKEKDGEKKGRKNSNEKLLFLETN